MLKEKLKLKTTMTMTHFGINVEHTIKVFETKSGRKS